MTRDELAQRAGVDVAFIEEAEAAGLVRPEARGRYPIRLVAWVVKLRNLRSNGLTWDEIHAWTRRRGTPGHEHEQQWPDGRTQQ